MTDHPWETTRENDSYTKEECLRCGAKRKRVKYRGKDGPWHFTVGGETCFSEELSPAQERLKATGTEP